MSDTWKMAPPEPTEEMITAGVKSMPALGSAKLMVRDIYRAMIAAAPEQKPSDIDALKAENERLREAHRHAVALRQCALFAADVGEHIVKAMIDASDFLDGTSAALNGGDHE